jgi:DNA-directed RNA polymerase subunit L
MEVKIVESGKDFLRLELPKGEESLLIPLVEALQADESVLEARYYVGHPFAEAPRLYLKTGGEKPQTVLKKTLKVLADTYKDALADFDKKTKKL